MTMSDSIYEILIVDDTPANLDLLRNILKEHGYKVRTAAGGRRALESARLSPPDLMLLDIMMPDMDGYETCRAFKGDPRLHGIPIVFISALDDALDKVKAFDCGAIDYIPKPFQDKEVIARVQNQLRIRDLQQNLLVQNHNLAVALSQLQSMNEQKNVFLGVVAHDLRNPLAGIAMMAELLVEEMPDDQHRKDVHRILDASRSMAELLTRFLDINRIESGQVRPEPEPLELETFCLSRLERFAVMAQAKGQSLYLDKSGALSVLADPKFLQEVVDNLMTNALKYSPKGKPIRIVIAQEAGWGTVSVIDEGPGFTEDDKKKVFGRFAKLSAQPTGDESSVGLGLSIVKHMVEAMDGQILLESEEGQGSTFKVRLPLLLMAP